MVEQIAVSAVHTEGANHSVRSALPSSGLPMPGGDAQYLGTKQEIEQPLPCVALCPILAQEYSTSSSHSSAFPE